MKKNRAILGFATLCLISLSTISCGNKNTGGGDSGSETSTVDVTDYSLKSNSTTNTFSVGERGTIVPMEVLPLNATKEFSFVTDDAGAGVIELDEYNGTFVAKKKGKVNIKAISVYGNVEKTISVEVVDAKGKAQGGLNFQALNYEEKAEVIGKLEGWAMDNHLTGITLFQNGGYVLYNERLKLGTDEYIPGYGYGNLSDGELLSETDTPNQNNKKEYRKYYHAVLTTTPKDINYLDSQGEVVGDLYGYISAGLWNTKMNAKKDGYEWYPVLAKDDIKPVPEFVDPNTGLCSVFDVDVKTGYKMVNGELVEDKEKGLVYRTLSTREANKKFDKRPVAIEDYLNAYKQLLTKSNGLSRGVELTSATSEGTLKGAQAYYNLTANGVDDKAFENVGIKALDYDTLRFTLAKPTTKFYAKYSLSSSLTQPFPEEFVDVIGGMKNYGSKIEKDATSEVRDNILCLGPYMIEKFDNKNGGEVIFKKNDRFIDNLSDDPAINGRYKIPGIYNHIRAGLSLTAILDIFKTGVIDACGVPQEQIDEYKDKSYCHRTLGDSTFKLNVNSCTEDEWTLHYDNGDFSGTKVSTYAVKPLMSNDDFLKGLNESINREDFAEHVGAVPSQDYFGDGYLYDPEEGKSYNDTPYHKANLANRFPETYGFNEDAAIAHFKKAVEDLVAVGELELGTKSNPTIETIDVYWMNTDDVELYGEKLEYYIEHLFNDPAVCNGQLKLDVNNIKGNQNYELVYSEHLQCGNFDLGFGSISGNALNPLNFMEVLKSDNSSGFTLNWGRPTNEVDPNLVYDGRTWSFDSLWTAANSGVVVDNQGQIIKNPIELSKPATGFMDYQKGVKYVFTIDYKVNDALKSDSGTEVTVREDDLITFIMVVNGKNIIRLVKPTVDSTKKQIKFEISLVGSSEEEEKEISAIIKRSSFKLQLNYNIKMNGITTTGYVESSFRKDDQSGL